VSEENSNQPASINDLHPRMQLEGTIRRVELYGAFVDIGLERDGLVHISRLSDRRVDRVSDVVKEGDRVTVWVTEVDPNAGRIGLAMVKPPDVNWRDLAEGQAYTGQVVRVERYGVFVDIGAEKPGLLHAKEMKNDVFRNTSEVFRVGDEVEVRILGLDRQKRRIDLTMENLADTIEEDDVDEEELPTPIEVAFRKAQETRRQDKRRAPEKRRREDQDDILSRTLRQHGGSS